MSITPASSPAHEPSVGAVSQDPPPSGSEVPAPTEVPATAEAADIAPIQAVRSGAPGAPAPTPPAPSSSAPRATGSDQPYFVIVWREGDGPRLRTYVDDDTFTLVAVPFSGITPAPRHVIESSDDLDEYLTVADHPFGSDAVAIREDLVISGLGWDLTRRDSPGMTPPREVSAAAASPSAPSRAEQESPTEDAEPTVREAAPSRGGDTSDASDEGHLRENSPQPDPAPGSPAHEPATSHPPEDAPGTE